MSLYTKLHLIITLQFMISAATMVLLIAGDTSNYTIDPTCPSKCGNVTILYPFGTTEKCSQNEYFFITCNETYDPPKPFLWSSNIEILEIYLDGHLRINNFVARDCYDENSVPIPPQSPYANLPVFPFSVRRNKFVGIGCDTFAVIHGTNGQKFATGCLSLCSNYNESILDGSCSGIGCCKAQIPRMLLSYNVSTHSYQNHKQVWEFNPCGFAFVIEEESFKFSANDLKDFGNRSSVPAILNWYVPADVDKESDVCEEAVKNETTFACKQNSNCFVSGNGPGYRCTCKAGYTGNPYIPNGCIDINECEDPKLNVCVQTCTNIPGNYTCSCNKGYNGSGRKDIGDGCVPNQGRQPTIHVVVGIGMGLVVMITACGWFSVGFKQRKLIKRNVSFKLARELSSREGGPKLFTAEELIKATDSFNESRIIGRGGHGTVYKGILPHNQVVAIKKSKVVEKSQIEQFINEVTVLSQINHRNVVKLLGCCLDTEVPLLVYEFVTNGTLYDHIHGENKDSLSSTFFSWEIRVRIAAETAGVLSYLHSSASIPIIHRDVKSHNILLDESYTAKVSDFGASRLVPLDETQLSTIVQGTLGYLDPEYLQTSQLTEKSDVYSFGVVLVELLTGKKALAFDGPEEERNLARYFLMAMKEDRLLEIIESEIVNDGAIEQIKEAAYLAKRCLKVNGEKRPTMKEVAMELEGLLVMAKFPWETTAAELKAKDMESLGVLLSTSGHSGIWK